jgi:hypothetical protein
LTSVISESVKLSSYFNKENLTIQLIEAAQRCGPSLQKSLAMIHLFTLCSEIAQSLLNRTWRPGTYTRFAVREPKIREIFAPSFGDRIAKKLVNWQS